MHYIRACKNCNLEFTITKAEQKNKMFCNRSCSAKFNNKTRTVVPYKLKTRVIKWKDRKCKRCNTDFRVQPGLLNYCSRECIQEVYKENGSRTGKITAQKRIRRSKDEIALFELCKDKFPDALSNHIIADNWDADIVIPSQNLAIMWNGPWHYKQLTLKNHSLSQVRNRDRIKRKLFKRLGWRVVIFEDRYWKPNAAFESMVARGGIEPNQK